MPIIDDRFCITPHILQPFLSRFSVSTMQLKMRGFDSTEQFEKNRRYHHCVFSFHSNYSQTLYSWPFLSFLSRSVGNRNVIENQNDSLCYAKRKDWNLRINSRFYSTPVGWNLELTLWLYMFPCVAPYDNGTSGIEGRPGCLATAKRVIFHDAHIVTLLLMPHFRTRQD